MAREILILRRLDHPNIIKLEGLITLRLSCSIYLVFEYMEHDVTGLLSKPEINFTESQIKCYMKQLLSGLEHCHSRGVMHRDIKGSNHLVNNEGILKVADFGLANFCNYGNKQPLTSRVVTLWYRPPELLLGSTDYGPSVDIWSVGCVFAELLVGKPILKGRTEVEQLHKIFKLCGSPPDKYWKKTRLPHATLFKPQQPYDSCLRETFKDFPATSVNLLQTLLSVDPNKRGTASSALSSEYTHLAKRSMPAKHEEETKRKKIGGRGSGPESRRPSRKPVRPNKLPIAQDLKSQVQTTQKMDDRSIHILKEENTNICDEASKPSNGKAEDASHMKNASQADVPFHGPLQVSKSSGFAWAKRRKDDTTSIRSHTRSISKGHIFNSLESSTIKKFLEYHSQELSMMVYHREDSLSRRSNRRYQDQEEKVEFSGPLISQMHTVDELLERHERHIRHTVRRSWFQRGKKRGN
ncbi:Protein kinase superfamily protein [Trifolium repens]|nr:Protein kinase superfamily protein [Trifolium repens]